MSSIIFAAIQDIGIGPCIPRNTIIHNSNLHVLSALKIKMMTTQFSFFMFFVTACTALLQLHDSDSDTYSAGSYVDGDTFFIYIIFQLDG